MKKPFLERLAVQYFTAKAAALPATENVDAVHFLNPQERAGLKRVERGAIIRACVAGGVSAVISAIAEIYANPLLPEGGSVFSKAGVSYWLVLGGVTLAASVLEILYLYWDTLRSMHALAHVAGLELPGTSDENSVLVDGLARAALELPNPVAGPYGINARRESSKWRLALASVAYKAKVGVTNFLVKMLVRRMLGRVFVRSVVSTYIPFVAVPITAAWNGVVSWLILREGRLRAMGPSAAKEMVTQILSEVPAGLSPDGRLAAVRAIGSAIVRTQDLHPNLLSLLEEVGHQTSTSPEANGLDDVSAFLKMLPGLNAVELKAVHRLLAVACIIDGRFARREHRLWLAAMQVTGSNVDLTRVEALRSAFSQGDGLASERLLAI